ncbi:MAG: pyruvate kinase alpha/beta domain-containing protein [Candidatus Contubernalis sp.]|nr:pyruvate kinase alpha/beta domain-containing protein [Candidatus Contubernalis sp.]
MLWEQKGIEMTEKTLEQAVKRGEELGIQHYVVASSTGYSAGLLAKKKVTLVCVRYHTGFKEAGKQLMSEETEQELKAQGVKMLTTTHLMGGIDRGLENKLGGAYPPSIVAHTLRMFGQGTKAAVEIAVMALDAGLIPYGSPVISIGGSGRGADTALVIEPAHAKNFFDTQIKEIICKPRSF